MARTTPVNSGYTIINGSGTGPNGSRIDVWIEYKVLEQQIDNNRSRVAAFFYAALASGQTSATKSSSGCYSSFSVNGVSGINLKNNGSYDFTVSAPVLMGSFDGWITHNTDGTKNVALSGSFTTNSTFITGGSASGTVALPTIPRATTPDIGVGAIWFGTSFTIGLSSRASVSFTHTLRYTFYGVTDTIVTKTAATTVMWEAVLELMNQIPNTTIGQGTLFCDTYNGDTLVGTKSLPFYLWVPEEIVPVISALDVTPHSANATADAWEKFVKGYSSAILEATAAGVYGSTIQSYAFSVRKGVTAIFSITQAAALYQSGIIADAGNDFTFRVTVTDSRGRTATLTTEAFTVHDFSPPTISAADVFRALSDGTKDAVNGTYISAKATFGFSSIGGSNSITKKIEYRQNGAGGWTMGQDNPADDTAYVFGGGAVSVAYAYEIRFAVTDLLAGTVTLTLSIRPGFSFMVVRPGGKGLGIGGAPDADEFQVYMDAEFKGKCKVLDSSYEHGIQMGEYHIWVDGSGKLRIKNGVPNSDTDGVIVGTQS